MHLENLHVTVTTDMYILSSTEVDLCLEATGEGQDVIKKLCNGNVKQLWEPRDYDLLVFSNVKYPEKFTDIGNSPHYVAIKYSELVFGQGYVQELLPRTECPVTCGWGFINLEYECVNANGVPPAGWINAYCPPDLYLLLPQQTVCETRECPAVAGDWSEWSQCSATCGGGIRQRLCDNPPPSNSSEELQCTGDDTEDCAQTPCPVDGGYGEFSSCSVTCGIGVSIRLCDNPPPANGGLDCSRFGPAVESCENPVCPDIDGGYTNYSICSATCGTGVRTRECTNPSPSGNGKTCVEQGLGPNVEVCVNSECPPETTIISTTQITSTLTTTFAPATTSSASSTEIATPTSTFSVLSSTISFPFETVTMSSEISTLTIGLTSFATTQLVSDLSTFTSFGSDTTSESSASSVTTTSSLVPTFNNPFSDEFGFTFRKGGSTDGLGFTVTDVKIAPSRTKTAGHYEGDIESTESQADGIEHNGKTSVAQWVWILVTVVPVVVITAVVLVYGYKRVLKETPKNVLLKSMNDIKKSKAKLPARLSENLGGGDGTASQLSTIPLTFSGQV
eukprot:CFRG8032T1